MEDAPRPVAAAHRETVASVSYLSSVKKTAAGNPTAVWQCAEWQVTTGERQNVTK